jgi:uncharacterized membrane protein (UPF0127 family)
MGKLGTALVLAVMAQGAGAVCAPGMVELRSTAGTVMRFTVELADDEAERALGLMNRAQMASSAGMLFAYQTPQHSYFWMKNTLIALDMIFADATGTVTHVHSNAKPLDTTPIDGGDNVTYVLEINGGLAKRLGLAEGAVMRSAVMDQTKAVWPCTAE